LFTALTLTNLRTTLLADWLADFLGREIVAGLTVLHLLLGGTAALLVLNITGIAVWDILRHRKTAGRSRPASRQQGPTQLRPAGREPPMGHGRGAWMMRSDG
jgi:hypothetical protein